MKPQPCPVLDHPCWRRMAAKIDWACAVMLIAFVAWMLWEIIPVFFDGRFAAVTGGK